MRSDSAKASSCVKRDHSKAPGANSKGERHSSYPEHAHSLWRGRAGFNNRPSPSVLPHCEFATVANPLCRPLLRCRVPMPQESPRSLALVPPLAYGGTTARLGGGDGPISGNGLPEVGWLGDEWLGFSGSQAGGRGSPRRRK